MRAQRNNNKNDGSVFRHDDGPSSMSDKSSSRIIAIGPRNKLIPTLHCRLLVIVVTILSYLGTFCNASITNQEIVTMTDAEAVAGRTAQLPCDVESPVPGEKLQLVIWYKEGTDAPIYSFDSRGTGSLDRGIHWQNPSLSGRGSFSHAERPATLRLEMTRDSDAGLYRCRVDFRQSPTRNSKVNLTVIIPPEQLSILDEDGRSHIRNYILGPYNEGSSLNITCIATGGRPQPRVTWWRENALLDDSYETVGTKSMKNVLRIERLERKHLLAVLTCQASNNNMVAPISSSVSINMTLKPLRVKILGENRPLRAGRSYEISCEVIGARPAPEIVWSKGGTVLRNAKHTYKVDDGNATTSVLNFVPSIEDAGKFITCRGSVPEIDGSALEDGWKLDIRHTPVVSLELGSNLNASAIREGTDVYFECNIRSNPWVTRIHWRHNNETLYNNAASGTFVSNQSLVLQSVTRQSAGSYTCVGSNQEGDGTSEPLELDVKYAPVCRAEQTRVYGVARQEAIEVPCELDANPSRITFTWKFNNTMEAVDIAQAHVRNEGSGRSIATYKPMTELDYGTLLCWGTNDQGMQIEPCVYHIVPAGRPDTPRNCTALNQTMDSLRIECIEGFDGGLSQRFHLQLEIDQVTEATESIEAPIDSRRLVHDRVSSKPTFTVGGLLPGSSYRATIFANNSKGRSEVVRMRIATLGLPERRTGEQSGTSAHPPSPENCTIRDETPTSVSVSCASSEYADSNTATYVLQVFDAGTMHLLASATSLTPDMLEVTDLPLDQSQSGLVLFLRIMTAHAISNATILQTRRSSRERGKDPQHRRYPALTPSVLLLSGPLLGAIVAALAGILLVIFVIVLAVRLRHRPGSGGGGRSLERDKDSRDDGGMSDLAAAATAPVASDKWRSTMTTATGAAAGSASVADSFDEKDPDVIPHANENAYTELSVAISPRYVLHREQQQQLRRDSANGIACLSTMSRPQHQLTYAELSIGRQRTATPPPPPPPPPPAILIGGSGRCEAAACVSNLHPAHHRLLLPVSSSLGRRRPILAMQHPPTTMTTSRARETPCGAGSLYARVSGKPSIYATPPPPHPYRVSTGADDATAETPLIGCDYGIPTIAESTVSLGWRNDCPPTSATTMPAAAATTTSTCSTSSTTRLCNEA